MPVSSHTMPSSQGISSKTEMLSFPSVSDWQAGLNFVGNAAYAKPREDKENIAQFEFIPWLLARCADLQEARNALETLNLTDTPFNSHLPSASLHWIIADASGAIVVESMADAPRLKIMNTSRA
mgnify:CR=1 FL=1